MGIRAGIILLLAAAIVASHSDVGFSFYSNPAEPRTFRAAMMIPLVHEEKYGAHPEITSLSILMNGSKVKIGLNPLMQFLLSLPGWGVSWDIMEKFQYPFFLTNFRVHGNLTPHSFVYFKQATDLFTVGVYSESSAGVGFEINKFEVYGGGAKAVLDPFGFPEEITWRVGVSKWL